jgi:hypothetical protein
MNDKALADALRPLVDAIDVSLMRAANLRARGGEARSSPADAARWLWRQIERKRGDGPP